MTEPPVPTPRRGRPIKSDAGVWTRSMCIKLRQEVWAKVYKLLQPNESYPMLFERALTALEQNGDRAGLSGPPRKPRTRKK